MPMIWISPVENCKNAVVVVKNSFQALGEEDDEEIEYKALKNNY